MSLYNTLNTLSGRAEKSYESFGSGIVGADEAFRKEYDKVMNSKESPVVNIAAFESYMNYVDASQFAIESLVSELSTANKVLKILEPLSDSSSYESQSLYNEVASIYGIEAKEGFGDKVKAVANKIWTAIKEAFRKLRLAIMNLFSAIRKSLANAGQKQMNDWFAKHEKELKEAAKDKKKLAKTVAIVSASSTKVYKIKHKVDTFSGMLTITAGAITDLVSQVEKKLKISVGNTKKAKGAGESERFRAVFEAKMKKALTFLGGKASFDLFMKDKGSFLKKVLYGSEKPKANKMKIETFFKEVGPDHWKVLTNTTLERFKTESSKLDGCIKALNALISTIEKLEGSNAESSANNKRENLEQLKHLRTAVSKLSILNKDLYVEFMRFRQNTYKVYKALLGGGGSEKDYQKDQKKKDKEAAKKI